MRWVEIKTFGMRKLNIVTNQNAIPEDNNEINIG